MGRRSSGGEEPAALDLSTVVADLDELLRRTLGDQVEIVLELDRGEAPVAVDRETVKQALLDLVTPACEARPDGGRLTITSTATELGSGHSHRGVEIAPGRYVVVTVDDSGPGPGEEALQLRLAPTSGTLAPSGGYVFGSSKPGGGSSVTLLLPRGEAPAPGYRPR
jgi:signal transduction histidine kinase